VTKTILSHVALTGERNRLTFDREAARELMHFGRWVFLSTALSFLAAQVDRLMLGKFVPLDKLGVYSIAMNLAWLTPMIGGSLAAGVLFPLLAHHSRTDTQAYERAIYSARSLLLDGTLFMLSGLALLAPAFFHLLYDRRYEEAAWMAQLLSIPVWVSMLMISADRAVLAVGQSRTLAVSNGCALAGKLAACTVGFHLGGMVGFILGLALGSLAGHIPIVLALRRMGVHIVKQDLRYSAIALATIGGGVLVQRWAMSSVELRWLKWVELGVALLVLVPLGWQTAQRTRQVMARK
jgi:O-antigen/teichoic acid export membrane protein